MVNEYIDTDAVAQLTGLSRSTLEKWRLRDDRIPFIKAGRCIRYAVSDVRGWMDARRVLSTSATPEPNRSGNAAEQGAPALS
jgi:excisionase family DNA binding protein